MSTYIVGVAMNGKFDDWFSKNKKKLYQVGKNALKSFKYFNEDEKEDIIQETLIIFARKFDTLDYEKPIHAFATSVKNLARTRVSKTKNKNHKQEISLHTVIVIENGAEAHKTIEDFIEIQNNTAEDIEFNVTLNSVYHLLSDIEKQTLKHLITGKPLPGQKTNRWRVKMRLMKKLREFGVVTKDITMPGKSGRVWF